MGSANRITELSAIIAKNTALIDDYLTLICQPTPSLGPEALWALPIPENAVDIKAARLAVMEACSELKALVTGPKELLRFNYTAYVSVKIILRFNLDKSFPIGDSTTFEAMSHFSGLSIMNVRRVIRHAILNHRFFEEKTAGIITHSALTAILVGDEMERNALVVKLDEFWPAGVMGADALEKWPNSEESGEAGWSVANNTDKSMYDIFSENPARAEKFGKLFSQVDEPPHLLLDSYPWEDVGTFVDVGGSHGSIAISIAKQFPSVKCIVQDLPDTVAEGAARLPSKLKERVTFQAHDFFTEQTVSANVYYFRSIFHNWADKYCIKILQNLIPALKKGARIIIHERILPGLDTLSTVDAKRAINMDIGMLQLLNAQQREMHEWPELFQKADERYRYLGANKPEGGIRWIIEAEWQG